MKKTRKKKQKNGNIFSLLAEEENNNRHAVSRETRKPTALHSFVPIERYSHNKNLVAPEKSSNLIGRLVRSFSDLMDPRFNGFPGGQRQTTSRMSNSSASSSSRKPMGLAKD